MTDVLPDRDTITRPIAARRYSPTIYDVNATAILRPGEPPIFDFRYEQPTAGIPAMFAAGADAWIFDGFGEMQEPPTVTPPPSPIETVAEGESRPRRYRPVHRRPLPLGTVAAAVVGLTLAAFAGGWMSHLLLSAAIR